MCKLGFNIKDGPAVVLLLLKCFHATLRWSASCAYAGQALYPDGEPPPPDVILE